MSNNLTFTLMLENQANKHITHNTAIGRLDSALTATLAVPVTSTNAATISSLDIAGYFSFSATNAGATGPTTITVATPAIRGLFRVNNAVGHLLTITIASQPGAAPALAPGEAALLYSDGTNISKVYGNAVEIGGFSPGQPAAAATLLRYVAARTFVVPAGMPLSQGYVEVAPTVAVANFDIQKNNSSVGTMSFAISSQVATFTFASAVTFAAGDRLSIAAPSPVNATLTDISFNFVALAL